MVAWLERWEACHGWEVLYLWSLGRRGRKRAMVGRYCTYGRLVGGVGSVPWLGGTVLMVEWMEGWEACHGWEVLYTYGRMVKRYCTYGRMVGRYCTFGSMVGRYCTYMVARLELWFHFPVVLVEKDL